jgi:hypothetical protein
MPRGIVPALSALFRKRPEAKPAAPSAAVAGEAA